MNLDDVMAVWQSQDAAPLLGVNKTLLHLALRQEQAKLQKERRYERGIFYLMSAGFVTGMALFLALMIHAGERKPMTGWDCAIAIAGAAAALFSGRAVYLGHRGQAQREQSFGESLRDQLNRNIAQLDDRATRARLTQAAVLLTGICPIAILLLIWRINEKPFSDDSYMLVTLILVSVYAAVTAVREIGRQSLDLMPRKRRLEGLLKELDDQ
jgi:hypothetical protein